MRAPGGQNYVEVRETGDSATPPPLFSFKKPSLVSEGGSARSDVVTFRGLGRPASTAGDDVATIPDSDVESLASASSALAPASHRTRTTSASSSGSGSGAGAPAHSRQSGGRRPSGAENGDGLSATPRAARRRQQRRQATSAGAQLDLLLDLWRQETERDAAAQREAAEREAAALAVQQRAVSAMDRVAGNMDRFATLMGEMVAAIRGSSEPRM